MPAQQNTLISNSNGLADDMDIDTVNSKIKRRPNSKSGLVEF